VTLTQDQREDALRRVLGVTVGMLQGDAMEVLLRAYVSVSRVLGMTKAEIVKQVEDLLAREPPSRAWRN